MKKTLLIYFSSFVVIALLLYFFSMSWMNFLFRPNLSRELDQFLNGAERLHPVMNDMLYEKFEASLKEDVENLPLFVSQYDYLEGIAPSFTLFQDTFTYIEFWEDALQSAYVLPAHFVYRNGKVFVEDSIGNVLPEEAEIISINDQSAVDIIAHFSSFVFAETDEERGFWAVEREYLNFFPGFFKASEYQLQYRKDDEDTMVKIDLVSWKEYSGWKKRRNSRQYKIIGDHSLKVIDINDLSYKAENVLDLRLDMEKIIQESPERLVIDLTDCRGIDDNYYTVQLLLSFLHAEKDYLIPRQITSISEQSNKVAIIPQETVFNGELYFLVSKYSVYPLVRTILAFSQRTGTGKLIGELPLSELDFYSNPYSEPFYNSYLTPKVNRMKNEFDIVLTEGALEVHHELTILDYFNLLKGDESYLGFISDTLL